MFTKVMIPTVSYLPSFRSMASPRETRIIYMLEMADLLALANCSGHRLAYGFFVDQGD